MGTAILDAAGLGDVKRKNGVAGARPSENADGFAQVFPEHKFTSWTCCRSWGHMWA